MKSVLFNRRSFIHYGAAAAVATGFNTVAAAGTASEADRTVRDRLWIWGQMAGAHNKEWNLPRPSRMTPAEGAFYLGVPNLMMVRYNKEPEMPFDPFAISLRPLKRVVWSMTGAGGETNAEVRNHVFDLAHRFPNITGFIMDDFFKPDGQGALTTEQLQELRGQLEADEIKRPLYVVLYRHQLDLPVQSSLALCDKITFWTWKSEDLHHLEHSFEQLETLAPGVGKLLGCYLWDYGNRAPMPMDLMEKQCALGREWLRQGRIEGMIFLGSNVCDIELETVEYARQWIAAVGMEKDEAVRP
ncbi:MAG TPA: hypothetical protein PKO23_16880 [Candidatus Hydrogenedentes bacterium]|jgi:hypothetical protein|nr:hypothetical protein [Candidatus Hydrogenedentota bacterium]HOC70483.1 hypothetical protein [Candidatus Hydrogenedentota bacterium]